MESAEVQSLALTSSTSLQQVVSGKVKIQVKMLIASGTIPGTVLTAVQCLQVMCVYIHGPV